MSALRSLGASAASAVRSHGIIRSSQAVLARSATGTRSAVTDQFIGRTLAPAPHHDTRSDTETPKEKLPIGSYRCDIGKTPMELIAEVPPIPVNGARISCDGGPSPERGHPIVYINLDGEKPKSCMYCGLRYYNAKHKH